jgi:peptidyl-prolyl cis-trans isomerase A (cyclophilin A)
MKIAAKRCMTAAAAAVLLAAGCAGPELKPASPGPRALGDQDKALFAVLETSRGKIRVRLLPQEAPKAVQNFVELAQGKKEWTDQATGQKTLRPLYDGTLFFRVIPGFMIQGGDPTGEGWGGPGFAFDDELFPGRAFDRPGLVAMANSGPNTNGSQFFITAGPAPWLNGKHTVIGEVVFGMDAVEAIAASPRRQVDPASGRQIDRPETPQVLKAVRIEDKR